MEANSLSYHSSGDIFDSGSLTRLEFAKEARLAASKLLGSTCSAALPPQTPTAETARIDYKLALPHPAAGFRMNLRIERRT